MINIDLYNNGVKVSGHSNVDICGQVSLITWNLANTIYSCCNIETSHYYTSHNDNPENIDEGLSYIIVDKNCKESMWHLNAYKHNIKVWGRDMWGTEVKINDIDDELSLKEVK
jgi:hypothetical protein